MIWSLQMRPVTVRTSAMTVTIPTRRDTIHMTTLMSRVAMRPALEIRTAEAQIAVMSSLIGVMSGSQWCYGKSSAADLVW